MKHVPPVESRELIRDEAIRCTSLWDKVHPLSPRETEQRARELLERLELPEAYVGWTMVALVTAYWRDQVAAVPFARRLLLLPHCLRDATTCQAHTDELGLHCRDCGACNLTNLRALGQQLGYKVMIAEGSPTVMQIILGGHVDAIVGVACLDALEKTFDKLLVAGIPAMAVPLVRGGCVNTQAEEDRVVDVIRTPFRPAEFATQSYLHLMRAAGNLLQPRELARLCPANYAGVPQDEPSADDDLPADPAAATESLAYGFLCAGGKHSRPFITLAAYDAMTGGQGTQPDAVRYLARLSDPVRRVALAIEVFHKASLVHDDIEDDDPFRYGQPAVHMVHGVPMAVNVGDYLVGLGYRLVATQRESLGADVVGEIVQQLAQAHTRLCEGQGAELAWRATRQTLAPLDVLKIYALKTAPAFEVALYAGIRLAGPADSYREMIHRFARHLGVGYQIVNDLDDWETTPHNKRRHGGDVLGGRPTVLLALAMERLSAAGRAEMQQLLAVPATDSAKLTRAEEIYRQTGVYATAIELIGRHRQRALEVAEEVRPEPLQRLLHFLVEAILTRIER